MIFPDRIFDRALLGVLAGNCAFNLLNYRLLSSPRFTDDRLTLRSSANKEAEYEREAVREVTPYGGPLPRLPSTNRQISRHTKMVTFRQTCRSRPGPGELLGLEFGWPNVFFHPEKADPIWASKWEKSPRFNPNYQPAVPYLWFSKPKTTQEVWNDLEGDECQEGQRCFLLCTRNIMPSNGEMFKHAFLVFGPKNSQVWGLWQGDQIFRDAIEINHWNAYDFQNPRLLDVECRRYCDSKSRVDNAERMAQMGTGYRTYAPGESNVWVRLVLQKAGISAWKGYDVYYPAP